MKRSNVKKELERRLELIRMNIRVLTPELLAQVNAGTFTAAQDAHPTSDCCPDYSRLTG